MTESMVDITTKVFAPANKKPATVSLLALCARLVVFLNTAMEEPNGYGSGCSSLSAAGVYLERATRAGKLKITPKTAHRAVLGAVIVAHKMIEDEPCSNV